MQLLFSVEPLIKCRLPEPPLGLVADGDGAAGELTRNTFLLNARPGHVQFFCPSEQSQIFQVNYLCGRNIDEVSNWFKKTRFAEDNRCSQ